MQEELSTHYFPQQLSTSQRKSQTSSNPSFGLQQVDKSIRSSCPDNSRGYACLSTQTSEDYSKFKPDGKETRVKSLNQNDVFNCAECHSELSGNPECLVCKGHGQLNGDDTMAKFMEYVLQFKLGLKGSYQAFPSMIHVDDSKMGKIKLQTKNSKIKLGYSSNSTSVNNVNEFCRETYEGYSETAYNSLSSSSNTNNLKNSYYRNAMSIPASNSNYLSQSSQNLNNVGRYSNVSGCKKISHSSIMEKCNEVKYTHQGYECDICQALPIHGTRYHCEVCEDFDMCERCKDQNGHEHRMREYKTSGIHSQICSIASMMERSAKLKQNRNCLTQSFNPPKIYSSSIH